MAGVRTWELAASSAPDRVGELGAQSLLCPAAKCSFTVTASNTVIAPSHCVHHGGGADAALSAPIWVRLPDDCPWSNALNTTPFLQVLVHVAHLQCHGDTVLN